ncbi:MAG: hypothetical protein NVSMB64_16080 [Candidatus Velthaea sp.]
MRFGAPALLALALLVSLARPSHSATQLQRAQIGVAITVNVTPGPFGYRVNSRPHEQLARAISIRAGAPREIIAQSSSQGAVPVQANVTPNPNATLLYSNTAAIQLSGTAGTTISKLCAFTVSIGTSIISSWTLDTALSNDFIDPSQWNGNQLSYNMLVSPVVSRPSPEPSTAYYVYPDNNNNFAVAAHSGYVLTYCVDLFLTIPVTVRGGVYNTTAIYALYY